MKKLISLNLFLILFVINSYSQNSFLGFDQKQCGLKEKHGYTFTNLQGLCSSHSATYKIFLDGNLVYEKPCEYLQFSYVDTLFFINDSTGFLIEKNSGSNHNVLKTEDYGKSWKYIGQGGPEYWGFYLINECNIYLITGANGKGPIITRASDLEMKTSQNYSVFNMTGNEAIINDTIFGNSFCNHDTLSFKVKEGADTIRYIFALEHKQLVTAVRDLSELQFEVYPNPCSNYIYFSQNILKNKGIVCKLYTLDGKLLKTSAIVDSHLYVGDFKTGIYLMEIQVGDKKMSRKIVKQ